MMHYGIIIARNFKINNEVHRLLIEIDAKSETLKVDKK